MNPITADYVPEPGSLAFVAIAYAILEAVAIATAVHAVFNSRSAQGATAWVISLVTVPLVALPLYMFLGRNRFSGYVDARRDADSEHSWIAEKARNVCDGYRSDLPDYGGRLSFLERLAHLPFTYGNRVEIFNNGEAAFESMFETIGKAEKYVLIQFFIVRADDLGHRLQKLLIDKAKSGVEVYFLYDQLGGRTLSKEFIRKYRDAGVNITAFRSSKIFANPFQVNFRNHRKVMVVDGDFSYVGGLNVGDEYLGKSARYGPWRDTHASVEGPSADALQLIFAEDWHWATGKTIDCLEWETRKAKRGNADVLILPSGPADDYETCNLMFVHAIHSAQKRFWIASPYFVPNAEVVAALQVAGLRGVDVRILLPANPDHRTVYLASFYFMKLTGAKGIRFYRYMEGFMHQKTFLIDDFGSGIGTANLDTRSFRLNFEITMLSVNYEIAAEMEAMFETDFACSKQVSHDEVKEKSAIFKLGAAGARLLSPIL